MSALAAVVFFSGLRVVVAGYSGRWFLPVVGSEVLGASFVFFAIAVVEAVLTRMRRGRHDGTDGPMNAVTYVALFLAFAKAWVEPHAGLSEAMAIDSGPSFALLACGLACGLATRRLIGRPSGDAVVWATAGWLIVGPEIYAHFDAIEPGARVRSCSLITAGAVAIALVVAWLGERAGRRITRSALLGLALTPLLFAAVVPGSRASRTRVQASASSPSFVLVVVDTLRADELDRELDRRLDQGPYLMPELRRLAASGLRFSSAVAPSPWTLPSSLTLLSGLSPFRHHGGLIVGGSPLPPLPQTGFLGPLLRRSGYQAAAFVNNPYLRPYFGFGRGFLRFRRYRGNAHDGTAIALSWIARHRARPFFVVLHLMDPHWPYTAPATYGEPRRPCRYCDDLRVLQYQRTSEATHAEVRRRYDAEVAFSDHEIGRFYDGLLERGLSDNTWLIVTADHGEEFWEHHRFLHGHALYDELLRVPLVIVPPMGVEGFVRGAVVDAQVQLEDIVPTLLELAGLRAPLALDGVSLVGYLRGRAADRPVRAAVSGFVKVPGDFSWAVRTLRYKLVVNPAHTFASLFDLTADPGESRNALFEQGRPAFFLRHVPAKLGLVVGAELQEALSQASAGAGAGLEQDLGRELQSLGYLN